jgi:hypothetical protein
MQNIFYGMTLCNIVSDELKDIVEVHPELKE